jgi:hypothetical protein
MKAYKYLAIFFLAFSIQSCEDFLDKQPLGQETEANFFNDAENAILAINGIYDVVGWDESNRASHNYEFMYGDILSDDAAKGSTPSDFPALTEMETWAAQANNGPSTGTWGNNFAGIYRANNAILNLPNSPINEELKDRLIGEAKFLRAYFYFYQLRVFGGQPLFDAPLLPEAFGNIVRSSVAETYTFIEADLRDAIELLPERSGYGPEDMGRATKGAARAYLARAIMYQLGTDNTNGHTWAEVKELTGNIIASGQYSLVPNYATLFDEDMENSSESIFEVQYMTSPATWDASKVGSNYAIFQGNRTTWGWGFNNPTQDLVDEFEANDPRLAVTVYQDGDVVLGEAQEVDFPANNETGYQNRKAAVIKPANTRESPLNLIKVRYADVLLMHAEAAFYTNDEATAREMLNMIRNRARNSTKPKGSEVGSLDYVPYSEEVLENALPPIAGSVSGDALLQAIRHERRVELAMESLRWWDQIRYGNYLEYLEQAFSPQVRARAAEKSIPGSVNPIPVMPIPLEESQTWGLAQNPGYN